MSDEERVTINGKPLTCGHCGNDVFLTRRAQLNTRLATFLGLDWINESADVFVCSKCGQLHWFLRREGAAQQNEDYDVECVQCGKVIPAGESVCAHCGWTYKP